MANDSPDFDSLFCRAIEIASAEERAAFIARASGSDDELCLRLERLVAAHFQAGTFLESSPAPLTAATEPPTAGETEGRLIGRYKLLQSVGEGGMGTVYLAEQTAPVRRMVALKVIKAGMDSRQVLARFEAERQALALMDHHNIAKVLDAGATTDGRPYFVMELVKGVPITRFCDERRLTPRERLELFMPVCQAVQHAHQKGIIHRDLKPSNVLVGLYDGVPVPKVIDFGVAKATGQKLTEATLFTGFGAVVGTLDYMSPEQAQLDNLDIDTRSDIYSLGVLLYELLTGTTPLDRRRLKEAAILEVLRVIREEDSPRPSMRLSTTEELPSIAACRSVEPRRLSGLVRGELDWIVMKALEKDRSRRYETANGLARDIQRYLADEVVEARPPSTGYRLRKFVRRHKGRVLAAALVLLALVAGTIGTGWGYLRAERARQAEARRAEGERQARLDAEQQKAAAEAAERATRRALRPLEENVRVMKARHGPDHPETLNAMTYLAATYSGVGKRDRALAIDEEVLRLKKAKLGPDNPQTLVSMYNLAASYWSLTQFDKSISLFEELLKRHAAAGGRQQTKTLFMAAQLGLSYKDAGRLAEALPLLEEGYQAGKKNRDLSWVGTELLDGYVQAKRTTEVTALVKELLDDARLTRPQEGPALAHTLAVVGSALLDVRSFASAEPLLRESLSIYEREWPDDWHTFKTRSLLGGALLGQNQFAAAEPLLLAGYEGMKNREKTIPPVYRSHLAQAAGRLVDLFAATNKPDEFKRWQAERALY
jgi:tetratricopeptide (TPR) repeat protein